MRKRSCHCGWWLGTFVDVVEKLQSSTECHDYWTPFHFVQCILFFLSLLLEFLQSIFHCLLPSLCAFVMPRPKEHKHTTAVKSIHPQNPASLRNEAWILRALDADRYFGVVHGSVLPLKYRHNVASKSIFEGS
ncbi:hypothetical protein BJX76DRAFT_31169 [Aspergillus varians]